MIPRIIDRLRGLAELSPDREALIAENGVWSYGKLVAEAEALAARLRKAGADQQRVAIDIPTHPLHIATILGAHLAGATSVPFDEKWTRQQSAARAGFCDVSLVVSLQDGNIEIVEAAGRSSGTEQIGSVPFLLTPTGGTSGVPKAIAISEEATLARFMVQAVEFGFSGSTRFLSATPLFHGGGRSFVLSQLYFGGCVDLHRRFDPAAYLQALGSADLAFAVPTMLQRLSRLGGQKPTATGATLLISGAPAHRETSEMLNRLGITAAHDYYASVEAGPISIRSAGLAEGGGTFGNSRLAFGVRIDPMPTQAIQPDGLVLDGITVSSHAVADGVLETDGFHPYAQHRQGGHSVHMSDRLRIFPDLNMRPEGRTDEVIISGGVNVFPAEVEHALRALSDVADATVVGIADEDWGQRVGAVVVPATGAVLTEQDLREQLRQALAGPQNPKTIVFVPNLPTTSIGKTDRRAVEALLKERIAQ